MTWTSRVFIVLTLILAALPAGLVDPALLPVCCVLLAVGIALCPLRALRPRDLAVLAPSAVFFFSFCLTAWLQDLPLTAPSLANPIWAHAADLLHRSSPGHVSVGAAPLSRLLGPSLAVFLAFVAGYLTSIERQGAWLLIALVAGAISCLAFFYVGQFLVENSALLFSQGVAAPEPLTGPFFNRNHAATYFGAGTLLCFTILISHIEPHVEAGSRWYQVGAALMEEGFYKITFLFAGCAICMTATLLTLSRAGVLITLATLALAAGLFAYKSLAGHPKFLLLVSVGALVGALFVEIWGGGLAYRIGREGLLDVQRLEAYRSTLAIVRDFPWFGTGLGTFADVFPSYKSSAADTSRVWQFAHNTPLEIAAEMGLVIAAVGLLVWAFYAVLLVRGYFTRRRDAALPLAGAAVGLLGSAHSLVDFPLQIPAVGMLWAAMVGLGCAQALGQQVGRRDPGHKPAETAELSKAG